MKSACVGVLSIIDVAYIWFYSFTSYCIVIMNYTVYYNVAFLALGEFCSHFVILHLCKRIWK